MQITVIDVGTPNTHAAKNGRSYQSLEVTYKGADGKVGNKKLMSFSNPSVFKAAGTWNKGDVVDVVSQKDDQGYWQWTGIGTEGGSQVAQQSSAAPASGARITGSNYETKEERAARQELIVRQSSLSNAVSILTVGAKSVSKDDVKQLAQELSDWVFGKDNPKSAVSYDPSNPADFEDDIPL